jgi:hypothetical protein
LPLFGACADDHTRDGDQDLLAQAGDTHPAHLVDARREFLAERHATTPSFEGEQVDGVPCTPAQGPLPRAIHPTVLWSGIELT